MAEDPSPERILLIRPSALGDVARTVPALVSLKRTWPKARIDWLVNTAYVDAVVHHPDLHRAIAFERNRYRHMWRRPGAISAFRAFQRYLREQRYDLVIDLQGLGRSGYLSRATGAPRRLGPADARELGWLGYTQRVDINASVIHTVDRMLAVVEASGASIIPDMRLYVGDEDRAWAHATLQTSGRSVALAPGALWGSKRWPAERFADVAGQLTDLGFDQAILLGSPAERPEADRVKAAMPRSMQCHDLVGQTRVGQLMAALERCDLVLANDSAALHLAIGLNRRCVGLFGPTDPARVGPYRYSHAVVAAKGSEHVNYRHIRNDNTLIATIGTDRVLAAAHRVLQEPAPLDHSPSEL